MTHLLAKTGSFFLGRRYSEASPAPSTQDLVKEDGQEDISSVSEPSTPSSTACRDGLSRVIVISNEGWPDGPRSFSFRRLLQFMGPAFLMSIAYIDPGNLESDLQAGARTGYTLGWVLLWSTVMGYMFQLQAAKLGVATGRSLSEHCRSAYPPPVRRLLWVMIELAIIGGDIQEVVGSAIALLLLSGGAIPLHIGVVLTAVFSFCLTFIERLGVRHLEALFAVLIGVMGLSFGGMFFTTGIPYGEVLSGVLVPRLPASQVAAAVGIVGAVIMPHNIYLHSSLVKSRQVDTSCTVSKREAVGYFAIESAIALSATLFINVAVMAVFAFGFYPGKEGEDIGLENAGQNLAERFGPAMGTIWAVGLLAAGQASTMTGTYTGQFVMSGFLNLRMAPWQRVLFTRGIALWPTLAVALLSKNSSDLDVMNQVLNIWQSVILPFALVPVLKLTSSRRVMGDLATGGVQQAACWAIALAVVCTNIYLVQDQLGVWIVGKPLPLLLACWMLVVLYSVLVLYLAVGPEWAAARTGGLRTWCSRAAADAGGSEQQQEGDEGVRQPLLQQQGSGGAEASPFAAAVASAQVNKEAPSAQ